MSTPQRILVVDDEPLLRAFLASFLSRRRFHVVEAQDGVDALETIRGCAGAFDLIITDIKMPRMDGVTLARSVALAFPKLPVLFMSAYVSEPETFLCDGLHWDFLRKPFPGKALMDRIAALLQPNSAHAG